MKSEATCAYASTFVRNYAEHKEALLKRFSQESCFGSEKKKANFHAQMTFGSVVFFPVDAFLVVVADSLKREEQKIDLNAFVLV